MDEPKLPPTPWRWDITSLVSDANNWGIAWIYSVHSDTIATARRIAACVNTLHGVPVELIESGAVRDALKMQGVLPMEAE